MAADAGAQQILDLLNEPSEQLSADFRKIIKAAKKAPKKNYGVMPQYGVDAVADMRAYYRDLRAQIAAIETVDAASKSSALEALDNLDRCFGSYERSLEFGFSKPAIPKAKKAAKRGKQAKQTFRQAIKGLSQ
jgi:hypothetical protein